LMDRFDDAIEKRTCDITKIPGMLSFSYNLEGKTTARYGDSWLEAESAIEYLQEVHDTLKGMDWDCEDVPVCKICDGGCDLYGKLCPVLTCSGMTPYCCRSSLGYSCVAERFDSGCCGGTTPEEGWCIECSAGCDLHGKCGLLGVECKDPTPYCCRRKGWGSWDDICVEKHYDCGCCGGPDPDAEGPCKSFITIEVINNYKEDTVCPEYEGFFGGGKKNIDKVEWGIKRNCEEADYTDYSDTCIYNPEITVNPGETKEITCWSDDIPPKYAGPHCLQISWCGTTKLFEYGGGGKHVEGACGPAGPNKDARCGRVTLWPGNIFKEHLLIPDAISICEPDPPMQTTINDWVMSDPTLKNQVDNDLYDEAVKEIFRKTKALYPPSSTETDSCAEISASELIEGSKNSDWCTHWSLTLFSLIRTLGVPRDRVYVIAFDTNNMGHTALAYQSDEGEWWMLDITCCHGWAPLSSWRTTCPHCYCEKYRMSYYNDYGIYHWTDAGKFDGACSDVSMEYVVP
ncbi:MAG: hypothetical protein U9Q22_07925, partial [Candidatus Altiarchaeota archaeon]|nr:hypothetical protein [Candidatus Altiarchaeota archaeon]